MPGAKTRTSNVPALTLDEATRKEIETLREEGLLGDGMHTEPRCYVCCEVESKDLVNKLLAAQLTNREITESCRAINQRRASNDDKRIIGARHVWYHRINHFNVDAPAQAWARKIVERQAEAANIDHINGVGHAITPLAVLEMVMAKGLQQAIEEERIFSTKETMEAATKFQELVHRDAGTRKMADLMFQMDRIISAAQKYVPVEEQEAFLAAVEGREPLQVLSERVHQKAERVIREFTPDRTLDERDEL